MCHRREETPGPGTETCQGTTFSRAARDPKKAGLQPLSTNSPDAPSEGAPGSGTETCHRREETPGLGTETCHRREETPGLGTETCQGTTFSRAAQDPKKAGLQPLSTNSPDAPSPASEGPLDPEPLALNSKQQPTHPARPAAAPTGQRETPTTERVPKARRKLPPTARRLFTCCQVCQQG